MAVAGDDPLAALLARAAAEGLLAAPDAVTTTADLGRGGNATVSLVRRGSGARAAFKHAHAGAGAADASVVEDLLREVALLRACEACNCIIRAFGLLPATLDTAAGFLLEDYGISLGFALHEVAVAAPAESERRTVARDLAEALAFLHGTARFAHLDVKPENVLVQPTRGWASKLADFGGASRLNELQAQALHDKRSMTAPYVAPECLRRELPSDAAELALAAPRLDVYAFGLTLWMIWQRTSAAPLRRDVRHPHSQLEREARDDEELCASVRDPFQALLIRRVGFGGERPPLPPSAPEDIRELITACWNQHASARPAAATVAACGALARAQNWRAVMTIVYAPGIEGDACDVHVSLAALLPGGDGTGGEPAGAGAESQLVNLSTSRVAFICTLTAGTECVVTVTPFILGDMHKLDGRFLGAASAVLLQVTPPLAEVRAGDILAECTLSLPVMRVDAATGEPAPRHLVACVQLERRHAVCALPNVRLGTLSLALAPPGAAEAAPESEALLRYDVMLSYADAETGVARGGDGFTSAICNKLRASGFSVYMFSERVTEGKAWQDVRAFGLTRCAAFVAVCSPTYACLDHSPWSANELRFAFAERRRRGAPRVIALWHTGEAPPAVAPAPAAGTPAPTFRGQLQLPDAVVPPPTGRPGAACHFDSVVQQLLAALCALGVQPSNPAAHVAALEA